MASIKERWRLPSRDHPTKALLAEAGVSVPMVIAYVKRRGDAQRAAAKSQANSERNRKRAQRKLIMSNPGADKPMGPVDISSASHSDRVQQFIQSCGEMDHIGQAQIFDTAWKIATADMLDEIHCMLRRLAGLTNDA